MNRRLNLENCRLMFKNFSGKESKYNRDGDRNFCVILDDEDLIGNLTDDGWNVRILAPRDEDENAVYYLPVSVSYKYRIPKIFVIRNKRPVELSEEAVGELDFTDIEYADIVINGSAWETNGKSGIKAYVDKMYIVIKEDPFENKYFNNDEDEIPFE